MNTRQEERLSMFYVVKSTCEKYRAIWESNTVFLASHSAWSAKIPLIEQNRDVQLAINTGIYANKLVIRSNMTEKAWFIANRLQSYASVSGNLELLKSVEYSATDMKKARDSDVVGICNAILSIAIRYSSEIAVYGANDVVISGFHSSVSDFSDIVTKPALAKLQNKNATTRLLDLFRESMMILSTRLDLDIELFRTSHPDFYYQYKSARRIVKTGSSKSAVLGNITVAGTGEPAINVTTSIIAENNGAKNSLDTEIAKPIIRKSTSKGNIRVDKLAENYYMVTIRKTGFKEQTFKIVVVHGETTRFNVEIERL